LSRPLDSPNATANTTRELTCNLLHDGEIVPHAHGRVEIDDLNLGKRRESAYPSGYILIADREPLALNKLNDRAGLKIDGRYEHQATDVPEYLVVANAASAPLRQFPRNEISTRQGRHQHGRP
jgi:hypothetical protein